MAIMPARQVWSVTELVSLCRAIAIDASEDERRALGKLLVACSVPLVEIRESIGLEIHERPLLR